MPERLSHSQETVEDLGYHGPGPGQMGGVGGFPKGLGCRQKEKDFFHHPKAVI